MVKKSTKKNTKKPVAKAKSKPAAKKKVPSKAKPAAKKKPLKKVTAKKAAPKKAKPVKKVVAKKPFAKKITPKEKPAKSLIRPKPAPAVAKEKKAEKPTGKKSKQLKEEVDLKLVIPNAPLMPIRKREESARTPAIEHVLPEQANRARYSDSELEEFREIIIKKIEEAKHELNNLTQQITNANDHGTDDTAGSLKMLEDGSESLAKEEAGQLAGRQKKFIDQLENALVRIENKTYGICQVTGKLIPKERLRAVPHTTKSIEAKLNQYRD